MKIKTLEPVEQVEFSFDAKEGFLYIDMRKATGVYLRIGAWQQGFSTSRWDESTKQWIDEGNWDFGIPISLDTGSNSTCDAIKLLAQTIPPRVRNAVKNFTWRQLVLLRMIKHCPETLDLLKDNPVLAWLLADAVIEKDLSIDDGCAWVSRKRKDILAFAGGPASDSMVKLLAKIRFKTFTKSDFETIIALFEKQDFHSVLRPLKSITGELLYKLKFSPYFTAWMLKRNLPPATPAEIGHWASVWTDTLDTGLPLHIVHPLHNHNPLQRSMLRMQQCISFNELQQLHDRWTIKLNKLSIDARLGRAIAKHGTDTFPDPPLPGTDLIIPITTSQELMLEGKEMHHCVASYYNRIMREECAIYRVLGPERATLEIGCSNGKFILKQFKTACNGKPSEATREMVDKWLLLSLKKIKPA